MPYNSIAPPAESGIFSSISDVTRILESIEHGDPKDADGLLPLVYAELRKLAAYKMAHCAAGHTLQPTALVHEVWLRLVGSDNLTFENRAHFLRRRRRGHAPFPH